MKYEEPEMTVVLFHVEDVITASNLVDTQQPGGGGGSDDDDSLDFGGGFN